MSLVEGAFMPTWVSFDSVPTSGDTILWPSGPYNHYVCSKTTTTAALTINLPTVSDGDSIFISNFGAITTLTLSPTVQGAPAGLTVGQGLWLRYSTSMSSGPGAGGVGVWYVMNC